MSQSLELRLIKARKAVKRGDHAGAVLIYEEILRQFPANVRAKAERAAILRFTVPAASESRIAAEREIDRLVGLYQARRYDEIVETGERLVEDHPGLSALHNLLGVSYAQLGRMREVVDHLNIVLSMNPHDLDAHNNMGFALRKLGRHAEALAHYEQALAIDPADAELHYNRGNVLAVLGRRGDAIGAYESALRIRADHADAHNNLGTLLDRLGRRTEAIAAFEEAVRIRPEFATAQNNLGNALGRFGRHSEAIAVYERVLRHQPDNSAARLHRLLQKAQICDWDAFAEEADFVRTAGVTGAPVSPLKVLALDDDPMRNRIRAERYASQKYREQPLPLPRSRKLEDRRLRIGYFSADFHNHATMYLMAGLFEQHDRDRFAIHIYSYGPAKDDEMRQRLRAAVDIFHDVRELDDLQVAELARRERIDIALYLKGHSADTRLGIFALRAAPVQLSYLGYPGTVGASFIDYIIADSVVIPDGQRTYYPEKIIYLPGSYQVNDDRRSISAREATRKEQGLPEGGFIFCCFNNSYKITPAEFNVWMRLLTRTGDSVLWLLKTHATAEDNLCREATRRGIDPARLIFAPRAPQAEHLARVKLADLFLDTFAYNAHTTASDALWAGVPVLTLAGRGFAARVAASLLTAAGLPELITDTVKHYEQLALELAADPKRLTAIRRTLAENRDFCPLFDTRRFTRALEGAYLEIDGAHKAGAAYNDIHIQDAVDSLR